MLARHHNAFSTGTSGAKLKPPRINASRSHSSLKCPFVGIACPQPLSGSLHSDMFSHTLQPRAELRLVEPRHAAAIWDRIEQDRTHLREWLSWVDKSRSQLDIEAWIDSQLKMYADNNGYAAGIWVDNQYAGTISTHPIHWMYRNVEIGYWLGAEFTGRGIVTAAASALITHAFDEWELNRVTICCAVGNHKSAAIPIRLDFVDEGILREEQLLNGRYVDVRLFSMLKRHWHTSESR